MDQEQKDLHQKVWKQYSQSQEEGLARQQPTP